MLLQNKNDRLASQRLELVFKHYSLAFWSGLLISVVPVLALWSMVSHVVLLCWMLALWSELSVRYVYSRRYCRLGLGADERKWRAGVVAIAAIDGAFWGLSVWVFAAPPTAPETMFVLLVIACVAVFDGRELAAAPLAATACLLTTLLPVALWFFTFGIPLDNLMGIAILGYLGLTQLFSLHIYQSICNLLETTERNVVLAQAQRENEQRMAHYFESAPGYFFTLEFRRDSGSAITFASPGIRELFGLEPDAVMRDFSAFIAIIHPDDLEMAFSKAEESRRELMPYHIEYRIIHPEKGVRWFEVHALPQRLAEGGRRWDGFMHDITERKRMEAEVKQREAEFRALADNLPDPVFRYDPECRRVYANLAAGLINTVQADQLLGNTPRDSKTLTPESAARAMAAIREVFATGERREIYVEYSMEDGKKREFNALAVPEYAPSGQVKTALAILHEVTDLREAERRAASFFANMPGFAFAFRLSPEGRMSFPFVSRGIEEIYGLRPEDVRADAAALHALAHPDDQLRIEAAITESARTLQPLHVEARVQHPGQPERWVEVRSMPERQADGGTLWHGVMLDITERKRMEESLRARENEYRTLAENFPDVVIRYSRDCRRIYVNPAFEELAGIEAGALIDKFPQEITPLLDMDFYMAELRKAMESGVSSSHELPVRRANGEYGWYTGCFVPEFDTCGNVSGVLMVARDITERKRMEDALLQSEAKYRHSSNLLHAIFESPSRIGIYALDREYRYLAFNNVVREGVKRLWGTDLAVGMSMLDEAIQNDDAHRAFCKRGFDYVLAGNNFYIESKEAKVKDGETVYEYHDNYSSPIYDDKGEVIGLTVFVTNTSERKQTEHKLEEYRAQLRGLLAQRESAREEERKLIARDVHDDLGQILTGLKMNLSVMERKCAEEAPALRELIQQSRALMDSAISTVRNISSVLRPAELDMGIAAAISWHAGQFSTYTGISCEVHLGEAETRLDENNAVALFRIVQESLTNIAKHARASRVNISLAREADDYVLKVCDNGIGFDVNLKKEGSFGLIGIKERVLLLEGELAINSEAGEGTEIIVRFPASVKNFRE